MRYLSCFCFCFEIHQGFIFALYSTIFRLFWVFFSIVLLLLNPSDDYIEYAINGTLAMGIIWQTYCCLRCYYIGLQRNNYRVHRVYLYSYIFFNVCKFFSIFYKTYNIFKKPLDTNIIKNEISPFFCFDSFWSLYEIYIIMIIVSFCDKVKRGFYGQLGTTPIYPGNYEESNHSKIISKGILEVNGFRIKNARGSKIEDGFVFEPQNQTKVKKKKKEKKNKYLQIFPFPLLN